MKYSRKVPVISAYTAKRSTLDAPIAFLEELIDACVLAASEAQIISRGNRAKPGSLHFPEEAAAKDLRFMDEVAALLDVDGASCSVQEADGTRRSIASVAPTHKPMPTKQDASSAISGIVWAFLRGARALKGVANFLRARRASSESAGGCLI